MLPLCAVNGTKGAVGKRTRQRIYDFGNWLQNSLPNCKWLPVRPAHLSHVRVALFYLMCLRCQDSVCGGRRTGLPSFSSFLLLLDQGLLLKQVTMVTCVLTFYAQTAGVQKWERHHEGLSLHHSRLNVASSCRSQQLFCTLCLGLHKVKLMKRCCVKWHPRERSCTL